MTRLLFREDAYAKSCEATVKSISERGIELDQTVFYATAGGQAGDIGVLKTASGAALPVATTIKDRDSGRILHIIADDHSLPEIGDIVTAELDWDNRHKMMRFHTCLHLLCAVIEGDVTGGNIAAHKARLDFNLPEMAMEKEEITAKLNELIARNAGVYDGEISVAELKANPELVRTMSVQPPMDGNSIRTVTIEGIDFQPCGGTHVRNTGEIGQVSVTKIEKKGRLNRRINIVFA
ncbi:MULTISPECIES: alanyl-tRNA editing protein [Thalassospira]|uniref:Alanine--tRNA ligase n=2 Tax=Thalassospira TaxID=168934 RepID=A0A367W676_9PROT|nr:MULTISPECIES: alanyl-tRNA editing protein [Thalassospira]MDG4721118.1 alanyl-tRNA editing protein [Thalassospira sp. FZY0004]RCK36769.1 Ala-tRNA(Pro) hydrolase [Thalassospira profundimaris]